MKSSLKNQKLFILFLWLGCHMTLYSVAQQKNPDNNISISAVNEPISRVLDKLSRNTGITFSYNPDHIEASRLISLNLKDKTLAEALNTILPPEKFGYRFSGKQVVIFRKNPAPDISLPQTPINETPGKAVGKQVPDTVFITNTSIQKDTIAVRDTITKYDTVYMMRTILRENPITKKDIFSNQTSLPEEQTKTLKFEPGISLSWFIVHPFYKASEQYQEKLEEYRNSNSGGQISGSMNIDLKLNYSRFSFGSGISYAAFRGKLDYRYNNSTGGFFLKDTLDAYYTLIEADTSWYYVIDSSYIPQNTQAYRYKTSLSHRYFEIPAYLQYNHPAGRNLLYVKAGIIAGFHSGSEGLMIMPDSDGVVETDDVKFRPVVFSYLLGAGFMIPINGRLTFDGGMTYRQHLSSVFSGFPVEVRIRAFGLRTGLVYKF
ncbi:MAG: hypothetical protein IPF68_01475 [Bacteroidales bacterium]|nr:hypothetical protein [Bacteroidales bacterium]